MAQLAIPQQYPQLSSSEEVPSSLLPSVQKEFSGIKNSIKYVQTTSGTVGASSTVLFNVAGGMGVGAIKSGSMYLKCQIAVTLPVASGGVNVNNLMWAGGNSATGVAIDATNNLIAGASSIIERLVITCNGVQTTLINNYAKWRDFVVAHCTSQNFVADLLELEFAGMKKPQTNVGALDLVFDVCIPLLAPFLNSQQAIPLYLLNNMTVELTTATVPNTFKVRTSAGATVTGAEAPTAYTVSNAQLVWEEVQLSNEFKMAMREKLLSSGGAYRIHIEDVYSISTGVAQASTTDYVVGLSLSSLRGVVWTEILSANASSTLLPNSYTYNGLSDAKLYIDNTLVNNNLIDTDTTTFAEMNRSVGRLFDYNICSILTNTPVLASATVSTARNNYLTDLFYGGFSTSSVSDWGYSRSGRPCAQVQLHLEHGTGANNTKWGYAPASAGATNLYMFFIYDTQILIDGTGNVVVSR